MFKSKKIYKDSSMIWFVVAALSFIMFLMDLFNDSSRMLSTVLHCLNAALYAAIGVVNMIGSRRNNSESD